MTLKNVEADDWCAIYVAAKSPDGPCKIGISNDPDQRLPGLQTGNADKLFMFATFWVTDRITAEVIETRLLDEVFEEKRIKGGEWVELSLPELMPTLTGCVRSFAGDKLMFYNDCFVQKNTDYLMMSVTEKVIGHCVEDKCGNAILGFGS